MLSIENRGKEMEESRVEAGIAIQTANTENMRELPGYSSNLW